MIITAPDQNLYQPPATKQAENRPVLKMVKNDRMAGSVPVWTREKSPANQVEQRLASAKQEIQPSAYQTALRSTENPAPTPEPFGFGDLIDMVNPLHHIPVVGHFYRDMTGDTIQPVSKIIGGALFGGPIGAGAGMVNVIAKAETGDDLTGHAMAMLRGERAAGPSSTPEARLASATQNMQDSALSNAILSFSDMGSGGDFRAKRLSPEQIAYQGQRPAIEDVPAREPITEITLAEAPRIRPTYNS